MDYIQLRFPVTGSTREILIARLSEAGCDGFQEEDAFLNAFIPAPQYDSSIVKALAAECDTTFIEASIAQQNWNATWEASFEPVVVPGFCAIRAAFHAPVKDIPHEIVITPKMSFGTGHHATTRLMMEAMRDITLEGKSVLDFGTGTGILAILAQQLGAVKVIAIDNDAWSVENALENIAMNSADKIQVLQGSLEAARLQQFDVILANINRHILLQYMPDMRSLLSAGGQLLLSGILYADEQIITEAATEQGFKKQRLLQEGDWIAVLFTA